MPDDDDLSIERITQLAIEDVSSAIREKIGRSLSDDESNAVSAIVGTEHFWARAEEMLMFVRNKSSTEVLDAIAALAIRHREQKNKPPETRSGVAEQHDIMRRRPCNMCNGSGTCYCIRKGPGTAVGCPRCAGSAECRHCRGSGTV